MRVDSITGVKQIVLNLKRKDEEFARGVSMGLKKAGLYLQRVSQQQVPREFSNLFRSARTDVIGTGFHTIVNVGYTQSYAYWVHERVEMKWKGLPRGVNLNKYALGRNGTLIFKETSKKAPSSARNGHSGNYWDPAGKGKAKFLEDPVRTDQHIVTGKQIGRAHV